MRSRRTVLAAALACLLGALGGWLGLAASYEVSVGHGVRLASGATIVVVLVALFGLAAAVAPLRRGWRGRLAVRGATR
jgi:manganese/iron transport system permease protein